MLAIAGAVAAWLLAPVSTGRMSLAKAAAKHNEVKALTAAAPAYSEIPKATDIAGALTSTVEFPSLTETLQPDVTAWANAAVERIAERYRTISPDDVAGLDDVTSKASLLTKQFPQTREAVATVEREFSNRSADFWVSELKKVKLKDYHGFQEWGRKRDSVKSILPNPTRIAEAENEWIMAQVEWAISRSQLLREFMPKDARDVLLSTDLSIGILSGGSTDAIPFREARQRLFMVALALAQDEARAHLQQLAFFQATERAKQHAANWYVEATRLGPDAVSELNHFRGGYLYLAGLAEKMGYGAESVPVPRPPRSSQ